MRLSKLDSVAFSAAPILMAYMFFIPGVSLAETLMLLSLMAHGLLGSLWRVKLLPWVILVFLFYYFTFFLLGF